MGSLKSCRSQRDLHHSPERKGGLIGNTSDLARGDANQKRSTETLKLNDIINSEGEEEDNPGIFVEGQEMPGDVTGGIIIGTKANHARSLRLGPLSPRKYARTPVQEEAEEEEESPSVQGRRSPPQNTLEIATHPLEMPDDGVS